MADEVIWEIGGRECDNYKIAELDIGEDNYLPHDCDWEVLGRAIGNSMHIKELSLCGNFCDFGANIKKEHLLALLPGFTLNRSIKKLTFAGLDLNDKVGHYTSASRHPSEELLNNLAQIFIDNKAFAVSRWIIVAKRDNLRWPLLSEGSIP